jgi:hypothetical protein
MTVIQPLFDFVNTPLHLGEIIDGIEQPQHQLQPELYSRVTVRAEHLDPHFF